VAHPVHEQAEEDAFPIEVFQREFRLRE